MRLQKDKTGLTCLAYGIKCVLRTPNKPTFCENRLFGEKPEADTCKTIFPMDCVRVRGEHMEPFQVDLWGRGVSGGGQGGV